MADPQTDAMRALEEKLLQMQLQLAAAVEEKKKAQAAERAAQEEKKAALEEKRAAQEAERAAQEEKRAAQEEKRAAQEAERAAQEEKRAAQEEKRAAEGRGFLREKGLPPLGPFAISQSQKPGYGTHPPFGKPVRSFVDCPFPAVDGLSWTNFKDSPSSIWRRLKDSGDLGIWNHESSIQSFCADVLVDVAALLGLEKKILVTMEVSLDVASFYRSDIVMFKSHGQVIGMCEIKKPSPDSATRPNDDLNHPMLDQQVCNYLEVLKTYHGVAQPIGIVSTYNQWKVCWLRDAQSMVDATNMDEISHANPNTASPDEGEFEPLFCSEIYRYDDPKTIQMLAWVIYKMYHAKRQPIAELNSTIRGESRKFGEIHMDDTKAVTLKWSALPKDAIENLQFSLITKSTQRIFLVQDYHGGAEGRVWLICNHSGKLCVMKLSNERSFEGESDRWNEIWKVSTFARKISEETHALFLPFAFHAHCDEGKVSFRGINHWTSGHGDVADITNSQVTKDKIDPSQIAELLEDPLHRVAEVAIRSMAEAGWKHSDLCWRHVALLPMKTKDKKKLGLKPILIDLGQCECIDRKKDLIDAVVEEGVNKLQREFEQKKTEQKEHANGPSTTFQPNLETNSTKI